MWGSLDWVDVKRIAEMVCEEMGFCKLRFQFDDVLGGMAGMEGRREDCCFL